MKSYTFYSRCFLVLLFFAPQYAGAAKISTVPVRNPGNPADTRYDANGYGSVDYSFRIGKYEVTNAEYVEFLNGVDPTGANTLALYDPGMTTNSNGGIEFNSGAASAEKYSIKPGRGNNPVGLVTWFDTIRFVNWLHNGQGSGDTESGAYTLLGGTPSPSNGAITRNVGAKWFLPNEDEWYKAAYHKNDGVTGNYWDYPTATNEEPYSDQPPGLDAPNPANTANFGKDDGITNGYNDGYAVTGTSSNDPSQNYLTDVGAYTFSQSAYGTFDQGGNIYEWNETFINSFRGIRGGSFAPPIPERLHASYFDPLLKNSWSMIFPLPGLGFRVATVIPEPSSILMAAVAALVLSCRREPRGWANIDG
jgi:formylglycine-generating enzyme required for sulfatase activity